MLFSVQRGFLEKERKNSQKLICTRACRSELEAHYSTCRSIDCFGLHCAEEIFRKRRKIHRPIGCFRLDRIALRRRFLQKNIDKGTDRSAKMQRALLSAGGAVRRVMQRQPRRSGDSGGSWFGPGTQEGPNGVLFGETPLAPGQKRKWEDWEFPYYFTCVATVVILTVGLSAKPDTRIETWARKKALERIQDMGIDDEYSSVTAE